MTIAWKCERPAFVDRPTSFLNICNSPTVNTSQRLLHIGKSLRLSSLTLAPPVRMIALTTSLDGVEPRCLRTGYEFAYAFEEYAGTLAAGARGRVAGGKLDGELRAPGGAGAGREGVRDACVHCDMVTEVTRGGRRG